VTERAELVQALRELGIAWQFLDSAYQARFLDGLADDVEAGGVVWELLGDIPDPLANVPGLRLLGGVHRMVLEGRLPAVAAYYPSAGGVDDVEGAWRECFRAITEHADELRPGLATPPQTNEVGRSAVFIGGYLLVADLTGRPLRLCELGASGGLNLRADRYWYETGSRGVGDPASPVRFVEPWEGDPRPPLGARLAVADRRGCDAHPIDPTTPDGRLDLSRWIAPDQLDRFARLQGACDVASRVPAPVDTADIAEWLERNLEPLPAGQATVVAHSIVWQYLDEPTAARARAAIERAGECATEDAPLAWLSYELGLDDGYSRFPEVRLRLWPGGEERLIAEASPHGPPVHWKA
jgi:hypothetical protein